MKAALVELARAIRNAVRPQLDRPTRRIERRQAGDPHFSIDELAEQTLYDTARSLGLPIAYYSEDRGLVKIAQDPEALLIVDPIDGSRPAMAGFESCCFSAAVVPFNSTRTYGDITHAIVSELLSGDTYYATRGNVETPSHRPAALTQTTDLAEMFWSIELTAHPVDELMRVYGHLVDGSVRNGAVFVFTSSSFSLTRLVSGQLDAHVDIGHRILMDDPSLHDRFVAVGGGNIACLFPYDIAAAAFIAETAGCRVTDAYGRSLAGLGLAGDKSKTNQCSIVAATNPTLHDRILDSLRFAPQRQDLR